MRAATDGGARRASGGPRVSGGGSTRRFCGTICLNQQRVVRASDHPPSAFASYRPHAHDEAVYVIHAFEKRTPQTREADVALARKRLADFLRQRGQKKEARYPRRATTFEMGDVAVYRCRRVGPQWLII
jgi:hypothetical protein